MNSARLTSASPTARGEPGATALGLAQPAREPLEQASLAIESRFRKTARHEIHPLGVRTGSWLEYAFFASSTSVWVGDHTKSLRAMTLPQSGLLRVEIVATGRETRFSHDYSRRIVFETPLCDLNLDGTQIGERIRPPMIAGQVAYPTSKAFWAKLETLEHAWMASSGDVRRKSTQPQESVRDGSVITLVHRSPALHGTPAPTGMVHTQIIDCATGVMLQGQGRSTCGEAYCMVLVNSGVEKKSVKPIAQRQ